MDFEALWLTLRLAVGTTAILLVPALPLAGGVRYRAERGARSGAGGGGAAVGVAAYSARILSAGCAGTIERAGTTTRTDAWASAGVQLCWVARGIGDLQPAFCRAAVGIGVRSSGRRVR